MNVGRLAGPHRRQAPADIVFIEKLAPLDHQPGDASLDNLEAHHALVQFLLGQDDLHRAEAFVGVGTLQRLERALHVGEILVAAGEGSDRAFDLLLGKQGRAFHQKTADLEFGLRRGLGRRLSGLLGRCLRMRRIKNCRKAHAKQRQ